MRKKDFPAGKDFKPGESEVKRSLRINFNDRIIKSRTLKLINEWKQVPDLEYYSRGDVARVNRVECDY